MNENETIINFINKKLEKYFIYNKLFKVQKYIFAFCTNYIFMDSNLSNIAKYTIYGFKIGNIYIDSSLNIFIEENNYYDARINLIINGKMVINNKTLIFDEKLQNISNYLDYVFEIENNN